MMTNIKPLRGEVYWADLEPVKGSEQGGSRPVFIVSNNLMNNFARFVIAIPLTRPGDETKNYPFNVKYKSSDWDIEPASIVRVSELGFGFAPVGGYILCNQARAFSKERLLVKMGKFTNQDIIEQVNSAIIDSYGLNLCRACDTPLRPGSTHCGNPKCKKRHHDKCVCGRKNPLGYQFCPDCGRSLKS